MGVPLMLEGVSKCWYSGLERTDEAASVAVTTWAVVLAAPCTVKTLLNVMMTQKGYNKQGCNTAVQKKSNR